MKPIYVLIGSILLLIASITAYAGEALDSVLYSYEELQSVLAQDLFTEVRGPAVRLSQEAETWCREHSVSDPNYRELAKIGSMAQILSEIPVDQEKTMRDYFGFIAEGVISVIRYDVMLKPLWQLCYCPMARKHWTQRKDSEMQNPYMGRSMPHCGTKRPW